MKKLIILSAFTVISLLSFNKAISQIADFFGEWYGYLSIKEGDKTVKYKLTVDFASPSRNTIYGDVTIYHDYDSTKIRASSKIAFTYEKSLNIIYYFGMAKTIDHKECSGNYIYKIDPKDINLLTAEFKPIRKGCVDASIKLSRKYRNQVH